MFEFLDKVVYINLQHRVDRRRRIEYQLSKYIPGHKIIRCDAIYNKNNGHVGCSESHIKSLKMAIKNNWKNVLIVEDDAVWHNYEKGYTILQQLLMEPYDVICLGALGDCDKTTYRMTNGQTSTAYLVHQRYYKTLLNNFVEGLSLLKKEIERKGDYGQYCIDQYWKKIQPIHNWYRIEPHLMYQEASYSDIVKADVDYSTDSHFGIKK